MTIKEQQDLEIIQGKIILLTYDEAKNPDDYITLYETDGDFITFPSKYADREVLHMFPYNTQEGAAIAIEI